MDRITNWVVDNGPVIFGVILIWLCLCFTVMFSVITVYFVRLVL